MSYVAEPYAQFVDDLLTALTGGHIRETFRFLESERPYRLTSEEAILPNTLRVFGQVENADGSRSFQRFTLNTDFTLANSREIEWRTRSDGSQAADARWPAESTHFYVNYEASHPANFSATLTDRSPGSVTRLLAESIGREYAVLSGQLEKVYQAGFLDTATGRDLDNLVALIGLKRRSRNVAGGAVTFSRRTPASADIFIAAGTRLSTRDAPAISFETDNPVTLQRGQLSVDAPIGALSSDQAGVVKAGAIVAINRPVLGIDAVSNAEATRFAGQNESDEALRMRARRALERSGQGTIGALTGALTGLPGLREKDIRFSEDPIEHPGIVYLDLALPEMPTDQVEDYKRRAIQLLEEYRPLGIRIRHKIEASLPPGPARPSAGQPTENTVVPITAPGVDEALHMPVDANVVLQPVTLALTPGEREQIIRAGEEIVETFIADAGLGETLVYNRLVSQLMSLDGVLDLNLELFPSMAPERSRTRNIMPNQAGARPVSGNIDVQIGNSLVALDITTRLTFNGAGTIGNAESNASGAADAIRSELQQALATFSGSQIDRAQLITLGDKSENFAITELNYRVEYIDAGIRINQVDVELPYTGLEHLWVRRVDIIDDAGAILGSSS
jgi:hypothetical protein